MILLFASVNMDNHSQSHAWKWQTTQGNLCAQREPAGDNTTNASHLIKSHISFQSCFSINKEKAVGPDNVLRVMFLLSAKA